MINYPGGKKITPWLPAGTNVLLEGDENMAAASREPAAAWGRDLHCFL